MNTTTALRKPRPVYSPRRTGFVAAMEALERAISARFTPQEQARFIYDGDDDTEETRGYVTWDFRDPLTKTYYSVTYDKKTKGVKWDVNHSTASSRSV